MDWVHLVTLWKLMRQYVSLTAFLYCKNDVLNVILSWFLAYNSCTDEEYVVFVHYGMIDGYFLVILFNDGETMSYA